MKSMVFFLERPKTFYDTYCTLHFIKLDPKTVNRISQVSINHAFHAWAVGVYAVNGKLVENATMEWPRYTDVGQTASAMGTPKT